MLACLSQSWSAIAEFFQVSDEFQLSPLSWTSSNFRVRTNFGHILRAEHSSNAFPQGYGISLLRSALWFVLTTSAYLGRLTNAGSGPVGVFTRQARLPISAVPYFGGWLVTVMVECTRAVRWIPLLLAELIPNEQLKSEYASTTSVSSGPCRWTPGCKVSALSRGPLFFLFVVIPEYLMYDSAGSTSGMARRVDAAVLRVWSRMLPGTLSSSVSGGIDRD